ncbi:MAG: 3-isopropylmalate dehydratase small subunit [Acidimicrobiia bacterium]|nr:3-isopropylmalate dehydratase small subunit [Acidimicrobiia bacterium]
MAGAARISTLSGRGIPLRGEDIDTDRIIPARYLRAITFEGIDAHLFEDDRAAAAGGGRPHPIDDPRFAGGSILVVNRNFGCGSSREHAPQAIHRRGIHAIVGESFSDIFFGNAAVIGLPCVSAPKAGIEQLMAAIEATPGTAVRVDLEQLRCDWDGGHLSLQIPAAVRDAFLTGAWDTTGMLLDRYDEVRGVAARLPYVAGFR